LVALSETTGNGSLNGRLPLRLKAGVSIGGAQTLVRDEQQAFVRELDALSLADSKQQSCARRANHV
jgi:hypothetical protein